MNIIILGPQGSGKGTQADILSKEFGFYHFDMGKHLRSIAKTDPEIDKVVNQEGALLADDQVFSIMKAHFEDKGQFDNILFEGYPRSKKQYELLIAWLSEHGSDIDAAFDLEIPEELTVQRVSGRRIDKTTGKMYHIETNPPGPEVNPENLVQRDDDRPDALKRRLEYYHKDTKPLIDELVASGLMHKIDATDDIEVVAERIRSILRAVSGK